MTDSDKWEKIIFYPLEAVGRGTATHNFRWVKIRNTFGIWTKIYDNLANLMFIPP